LVCLGPAVAPQPIAKMPVRQSRLAVGRRSTLALCACVFSCIASSTLRSVLSAAFTSGSAKAAARTPSVASRAASRASAAPASVGRLGHGMAPFNTAASPGMKNALQQLRGLSAIVPDEFSLEQYEEFGSSLAFVSSRTILEALESESWPRMGDLVEEAQGNEECAVDWDLEEAPNCFEESLFVLVGRDLLAHPGGAFGTVSTELPASALTSPAAAVASAGRMMAMYRDLGVAADRVLFRVPANYWGLRAVAALSKAGFASHVTHVYSLAQAALAKEAGAFAVQVYVGRIERTGAGDGITLARQIYRVLKDGHDDNKKVPLVVAASLSSLEDVSALAGADYLLVPPRLLRELRDSPGGEFVAATPETGIRGPSSDKEEDPPIPSGFLLSFEEFEAAMPNFAKQLLASGVERYLQQATALHELLTRAKEYM